MHFALINNIPVEASPGLKGTCRGCGQPVIAKCGTVRVHHWAHQKSEMCDQWWEQETQWHRSWKNNFPQHWQECFMPDEQTGEKHIADIRTDQGLVIEFQRSHLKPKERTARENFYRNMVWVVDGTRLTKDYPRFVKAQIQLQVSDNPRVFYVYYPEKCFPSAWLNSSVPVLFDFKGKGDIDGNSDLREPLHCLLPGRVGMRATLARIPRSAFIKAATNGDWSEKVQGYIEKLLKEKEKWDTQGQASEVSWQRHMLQMRNLRSDPGQ